MESRLSLYLLGPPRIECDGAPIKLDRRKAIALLAYLAVAGQRPGGERHRRDSLVNLLWPEYDGPRGRAALRRTLYALRKALDGPWLEVDRNQVGLCIDAGPSTSTGKSLWVDVVEFQRHLAECKTHGHPTSHVCAGCEPPLSEAAALVRGDFMSGFGLKDSVNFDDWQLMKAEELRRKLSGALERLVRWYSAQHEFESALVYARRRLGLDALDEATHRHLMRLHAWSGRRTAALRQYDECVAVLEAQLGVPPDESTTELWAAIQGGRIPPLPEKGQEQGVALTLGRGPETGGDTPSFLEEEVSVERPPFVARERELALLIGHLDAALAGRGRVAFVIGNAGSGKTALIQEFGWQAQETHSDLIVASGSCNAHTGIGDPYHPLREILELLTGDVKARWAAGAMTREQARRLWHLLPMALQALVKSGPDLVDAFVPSMALLDRAAAYTPGKADWLLDLHEFVKRRVKAPVPSPLQSDLFEQYTRVLQYLASQVPLVLVVDDLQWADLGSISLLFHLGRYLAGSRILLVGAYRPEELAIGRDGERHPLAPVVSELQRQFGEVVVDVDRAERQEFLEDFLDMEPNRLGAGFREMLYRQTRGHPLFTIELLRGMQERGDLQQDQEGRWAEGPTLDWVTLPARVEAVVAERIGRLTQPLRAALRVASVEGETFTAEVVARVRASDEGELLGRLSTELDRRHRLVRAQSIQRLEGQLLSRYRFRHILFQKYLYASLDEVERVHLHEKVGTALEQLYGAQEGYAATVVSATVAVQLARHFQEARITEKAAHYLHRAGERALELSAYQEAIAHLTKGLELLMTLPDSADRAQQELGLQISLGMAWKWSIPGSEGEKVLTRARELCQQLGRTTQLCQVVGELSIFPYVRAEYQTARELGEEALSLAQQVGDPLLVALHRWNLGYVLFGLGEFTKARAHLQQVVSFYRPREHHHTLVSLRGSDAGVSALAYDACCLWCLGFPEQAFQRSQESLDLARELGHPFSLADVLCYGGCVFSKMRRDAQALKDHGQELMRLSRKMGFVSFAPTGTCYWGEALTKLGKVEEGMAQLHEGIAGRKSVGVWCASSGILGGLAEAQAIAGQPEEGLATLAEALAMVEETNERYAEAELYWLRARLLLAQGDDAEAEATLYKAVAVSRRQDAKSWELRATTSLARLWQRQGRTDEARQVLAQIYGWFTEGFDTPDLTEARNLLEEIT